MAAPTSSVPPSGGKDDAAVVEDEVERVDVDVPHDTDREPSDLDLRQEFPAFLVGQLLGPVFEGSGICRIRYVRSRARPKIRYEVHVRLVPSPGPVIHGSKVLRIT
jgi:hypothetical protein